MQIISIVSTESGSLAATLARDMADALTAKSYAAAWVAREAPTPPEAPPTTEAARRLAVDQVASPTDAPPGSLEALDYILLAPGPLHTTEGLVLCLAAAAVIMVVTPGDGEPKRSYRLLKSLKRNHFNGPVLLVSRQTADAADPADALSRLRQGATEALGLKAHILGHLPPAGTAHAAAGPGDAFNTVVAKLTRLPVPAGSLATFRDQIERLRQGPLLVPDAPDGETTAAEAGAVPGTAPLEGSSGTSAPDRDVLLERLAVGVERLGREVQRLRLAWEGRAAPPAGALPRSRDRISLDFEKFVRQRAPHRDA